MAHCEWLCMEWAFLPSSSMCCPPSRHVCQKGDMRAQSGSVHAGWVQLHRGCMELQEDMRALSASPAAYGTLMTPLSEAAQRCGNCLQHPGQAVLYRLYTAN